MFSRSAAARSKTNRTQRPRPRWSTRYAVIAAHPLYSDKIRIIISGCFFIATNAPWEATVKSSIAISFAAVLALLISIPTGAGAVGVGKQCGGFVIYPQECNPGLFCQRKPGQCFIADISGTCARKPRFCPQVTGPKLVVCGCDGKTYGNDCMRQQAGVSLSHKGKCE
jgi:hypothetical protein